MPRVAHLLLVLAYSAPAFAGGDSATPWWIWPLALFAVTLALGVIAVLAGVGGGVLFVPIVASFFPFHIDFVRGAGLQVTDIEVLRGHYAQTVRAWRERFLAHREEVERLYDARFFRMWEFLLACSEIAFRGRGAAVMPV